MNAEDRASYDNLKRMIENLENEADRIVRRDDLRNAARLGSRGDHNWYLFSHIPLNGVEVSIINTFGAKVKSIKYVYLIGLYIITLTPNDEDEYEESDDEQEEQEEDEVSNSSCDSDSEVEETDEVSELSEEVESKPVEHSTDPH
jgi:hypothetical protein